MVSMSNGRSGALPWRSKRTRVQNRWACSGSSQATGKKWLFRASWPSSEAIGRLWRIHTFPSAMAHSTSCGRAKACSAAIANCAMRRAQSFGKHSACRCEPATGLRIRPACGSSVKRASFSTIRRLTTARSSPPQPERIRWDRPIRDANAQPPASIDDQSAGKRLDRVNRKAHPSYFSMDGRLDQYTHAVGGMVLVASFTAATAAGLAYDIHTVWTAAPMSSGLETPITLL